MLSLCPRAAAQFTGFSIPQTINVTPFPAGTACTGTQQIALVANMGQSEHYITATTSGVAAFRATVQASHDGVTFNDISDVLTTSGSTAMGQGYYSVVQVSVTCATASGTFGVRYSGQATAPAMQIGALQSAQVDKTIAAGASAGSNFTSQQLRTPFGTSGGALYFQYSGAGPAGSTLAITCGTLSITPSYTTATFPLSTSAVTQFFGVPLLPCDFLTVTYSAGGASAQTFTLSYVFGVTNITGGDPCQGATVAKSSVAINAAAATQKLVAELANHSVYICGYDFTLSTGAASATAQWQSGTGAACAVATVNLGGAETVTTAAATSQRLASAGGGYTIAKTAMGSGLCLAVTGAGSSAQGILTFIQQ